MEISVNGYRIAPYVNLVNADLRGVDLGGAGLGGADLREADLSEADLSEADLEGANLRGADLRRADLSGAYLKGADLRGADLVGANMEGANLEGANLEWAILECANLSRANLKWADLSVADLRGADLCHAVLHWAQLNGTNLSGVNGLPSSAKFLASLKSDKYGIIVYKVFHSCTPQYQPWIPKPGLFITETALHNRTIHCGCGINVATLEWCQRTYPHLKPWKCRIRWIDLADTCIPYNTDGKFRCERLEILKQVE